MNIKELHHTLNKEIYDKAFTNLNSILGHNKSSSVSAGIYLKLPITVRLIEADVPILTATNKYNELLDNSNFYVRMSETKDFSVYFDIQYHKDQKLTSLYSLAKKVYDIFTLIYLHELQHIISLHTTSTFDNMMINICKKAGLTDSYQINSLINIAEDYRINYTIDILCSGTQLAEVSKKFIQKYLYSSEYRQKKLSEIDILKELLKDPNKHIPDVSKLVDELIDRSGSNNGEPMTGDAEALASSLAESLKGDIESALRGSGRADMLSEIMPPVEVSTGWFDKLQKTFTRQVYYATNDYSVKWSALNNTYRHIFKSPKREYYDDAVSIILAIDQSGSMNIKDMGKLLYLIQTKASKIINLTVLIHDYEVGKVFTLNGEYDSIADDPEFKTAVATRHMAGGTSHHDVFKHVSKLPNLQQSILILFTDGYSDLQHHTQYPKLKQLSSKIILLTENNPQNLNGFKEIRME